jgi:hypothetical protein
MKTNTKIVDLVYEGFSPDLIKSLSPKQIDVLHSKLMEGKKKSENKEQVTQKPQSPVTQVGPQGGVVKIKPGQTEVSLKPVQGAAAGTMEVSEGDDTDDVTRKNSLGSISLQGLTGQEAPHDANDMAPDGMDDDSDYDRQMMGMAEASKDIKYQEKKDDKLIFGGEKKESKEKKTDVIKRKIKKGLSDKVSSKKSMGLPIGKLTTMVGNLGMMQEGKKQKKNPFAICTAQMGKEFGTTERSEWSKGQMEKYEDCVMGVKNTIKEGRNVNEYLMEMEVERMLQKNVSPKMTKKDFLNVVFESSPATKPDTKPTTKPGTKPNPSTPYSPKPGPKPNPKAKTKSEVDEQSPATKPDTKPTTKPGTKPNPSTPYSPKPGPKPNPKAGKKSVPAFLNWNKIGVRF